MCTFRLRIFLEVRCPALGHFPNFSLFFSESSCQIITTISKFQVVKLVKNAGHMFGLRRIDGNKQYAEPESILSKIHIKASTVLQSALDFEIHLFY